MILYSLIKENIKKTKMIKSMISYTTWLMVSKMTECALRASDRKLAARVAEDVISC